METITLEYDVRNESAKELIENILSSGLATRKMFASEGAFENVVNGRLTTIQAPKYKDKQVEISALPFSAGLWADYDIDDRTLRSKAWGTHKRAIQ